VVSRVGFPALALLAALVLACGGNSETAGTPAPTARATATVSKSGPRAAIEPTAGPPGVFVSVTGAGWPAGAIVVIAGAGASAASTPYASLAAGTDGSFSARFRLEKAPDGSDLKVGRFDLVVRSGETEVTLPFLVEVRRPLPPPPGG